ncbi:MAG: DUF2288 domain-containing protein [Gammaproteobacteria bacterium]|nr:DUF2288 domain-containing protein [Gammaproteobacteria bacterium]
MTDTPKDLLRDKINLETSRINWLDLQTFFARGQVVRVSTKLDLVNVAYTLSLDDKNALDQWMKDGDVGEVDNQTAQQWFDQKKELWSVVVRPWVLVQDPGA